MAIGFKTSEIIFALWKHGLDTGRCWASLLLSAPTCPLIPTYALGLASFKPTCNALPGYLVWVIRNLQVNDLIDPVGNGLRRSITLYLQLNIMGRSQFLVEFHCIIYGPDWIAVDAF